MNLADITVLSNGPVLELIEWLQGQNCLASPLRCVPCNRGMDLTVRNEDHVDGFLWFVFIQIYIISCRAHAPNQLKACLFSFFVGVQVQIPKKHVTISLRWDTFCSSVNSGYLIILVCR